MLEHLSIQELSLPSFDSGHSQRHYQFHRIVVQSSQPISGSRFHIWKVFPLLHPQAILGVFQDLSPYLMGSDPHQVSGSAKSLQVESRRWASCTWVAHPYAPTKRWLGYPLSHGKWPIYVMIYLRIKKRWVSIATFNNQRVPEKIEGKPKSCRLIITFPV